MKKISTNGKGFLVSLITLSMFLLNDSVASAFLFVNWSKFEVKDVHPWGFTNIVVLEDEDKQEKWYFIPKHNALESCDINEGDTIKARVSEDSKQYNEYLESIRNKPLTKQLTKFVANRSIIRLQGCYNYEP